MDFLYQLRAFTYRRQLLDTPAATMGEALHTLVGVYSSHPTAPLNLWARSQDFSPEGFRALERDKQVARIPAHRGSIFLVTMNDAALIRAGGPINFPITDSWLKYTGLNRDDLPAMKRQVVEAATTPLTPAQLRTATGIDNQRLTSIARLAAYEGDMLRIGSDSLRSNSLKYVSTKAWHPTLIAHPDADEALVLLAERYFAAYGPARIEDFRWWRGLPGTVAAKAALAESLAPLNLVDVGEGQLLPAALVPDFEATTPLAEDAVAVLPKWDTYIMGLALDNRARFVDPAVQSRIYNSVGDGLSTVFMGGKAVAAWHHNFKGKTMQVTLDIFDDAAQEVLPTIRAKFEEIAAVLNGKSVEVAMATTPLSETLSFIRRGKGGEEDMQSD